MVRIGNKEIPDRKNVSISLTYIYGIGRSRAKEIVKKCGIDPFKKTKELSEEQIKSISHLVNSNFTVEERLKEKQWKIIDSQIKLGTYRGLRRSRRPNPLPVRGQRTRHNARTAKGKKRSTVANKKKAPSPK
jgi:small subunit ribosomal protein S13